MFGKVVLKRRTKRKITSIRHVFNSKKRTKRFPGKTPEIPGNLVCLKKAYQTQNPHKSNKITLISRHVFNSKRRTKSVTGKIPVFAGKCFCLKKAYQTQNQHKTNKLICISRYAFNLKRRTKRFPGKSPANAGKCFCFKKAYQTQNSYKTHKDYLQNRWIFSSVFYLKRRTKRKNSVNLAPLLRTLVLSLVAVFNYKTR